MGLYDLLIQALINTPTSKLPSDEMRYRGWLDDISKMTGVRYNPNDPNYDYRKAFALGVKPTFVAEHNQFRWPDIGKSKNYSDVIDHETGMPKEALLQNLLKFGAR